MDSELEITFKKDVYTNIFEKFCNLTLHSQPETITKQIQLIDSFIQSYVYSKETYFEIGCGEGRYTESIGKLFKNRIVIEPNPVYANKAKDKGCIVYESTLMESNIKELFDICLCSHVFYYFSDLEIYQAIQKLQQLKKTPDTKIIISIDQDEIIGSNLEDIKKSIEETLGKRDIIIKEERSVRPLIRILKDNKIDFEEKKIDYDLSFYNYDDIYFIFKFFIMECKVDTKLYNELNEKEQNIIDQIIYKKCESLYLPYKIKRIESFICF